MSEQSETNGGGLVGGSGGGTNNGENGEVPQPDAEARAKRDANTNHEGSSKSKHGLGVCAKSVVCVRESDALMCVCARILLQLFHIPLTNAMPCIHTNMGMKTIL